MTNTLPSSREVREVVGEPPLVDLWTTLILFVMCAGFPVAGLLYHQGHLSWWATVLIGTFLMNLSFTAWHEPSHRNYSRIGWLNTVAGWIASFASMYPGYYARRREHLVHHRFEGEEGKDPVYPRLQTSFWLFPLTLLKTMFQGAPNGVPDSFLPMTTAQRVSDWASNLLAFGVVAFSVWQGFWPAVVLVWVVPRLFVFLVHAYYICFFPHSHEGDGFVVLRIRQDNPVLRFLTMNQHLHGIHHRWPWVPWHQYRKVLQSFPEELHSMKEPTPVAQESALASQTGP